MLHTSPTTQSGRRAQNVTLAHALGLVVGVHFSLRHMRVALADVAHTVVAEHHMPLAHDHRADNELDRTTLLIADMLDSVQANMSEVLAVAIALPAPIEPRHRHHRAQWHPARLGWHPGGRGHATAG